MPMGYTVYDWERSFAFMEKQKKKKKNSVQRLPEQKTHETLYPEEKISREIWPYQLRRKEKEKGKWVATVPAWRTAWWSSKLSVFGKTSPHSEQAHIVVLGDGYLFLLGLINKVFFMFY